jgi:DNA-binding IclR family transcriptional regulator
MSANGNPPRAALLTVDRGMQVLRAFRCDRACLSNVELVGRTRLPKATVSRLTSTLLELGFLRHVPGSRKFELATGAFAIGHAFVGSSPLLQRAASHLRDLADALNVSVALAAGDGLEMLYVGYKAGRGVGTLRMGVGSVLPLGSTAIGHAYLYGVPDLQRQRLLDALKAQSGIQDGPIEESICRSFADLASTGTCGVLGGHRPGTFGIALPVVVGRDRVVMGLSCGMAEARTGLEAEQARIAPALRTAARELEEALADIAA